MEQYSPEQLNMIRKFRSLRAQGPDSAYMKALRARLLTTVAQERSFVRAPWIPNMFRFALRAGVALCSIALVGIGASFASQYILPNNFLYPVKLAAERARIGFAGDGDASKVALRSQFAQTRITEIKMLESNDQLDDQAVLNAMSEYMRTIDQIHQDVGHIAESQSETALSELLQSEQKTDELDRHIRDLATGVQGKSLSDDALARIAGAVKSSYALRIDVKQRIVGYEMDNQTLAGDTGTIARVSFLLDFEEGILHDASDTLTQRIQADTRALVQQQSKQNPNVAPEKLAITLPQSETDLQQAIVGVQQNMVSLRAKINQIGAQFSQTEQAGILGQLSNIAHAVSAIASSLSNQRL